MYPLIFLPQCCLCVWRLGVRKKSKQKKGSWEGTDGMGLRIVGRASTEGGGGPLRARSCSFQGRSEKAQPCLDSLVRVYIERGRAFTASRWPLRVRRSRPAAGHRIRKPYPASTYRWLPHFAWISMHVFVATLFPSGDNFFKRPQYFATGPNKLNLFPDNCVLLFSYCIDFWLEWLLVVKRREQAEEGVAGKKGWYGIANRRARILSTLLLICCSCGDDNEEE